MVVVAVVDEMVQVNLLAVLVAVDEIIQVVVEQVQEEIQIHKLLVR